MPPDPADPHDSHLLLCARLAPALQVKEFGFTEVVTLSRELAEDLKFLAMEEHDLATGRATLYQRIAHDAPWTTVRAVWRLPCACCPRLHVAMPCSLAVWVLVCGILWLHQCV